MQWRPFVFKPFEDGFCHGVNGVAQVFLRSRPCFFVMLTIGSISPLRRDVYKYNKTGNRSFVPQDGRRVALKELRAAPFTPWFH